MSHARQQIRERIVATLKAADIPGINAKVRGSIFIPLLAADLPSICVYPEDEAIRLGTMGMGAQRELDREVHIIVKVFAGAAEDVENDVDDYCAAVESLLVDTTLGGLTYDGRLFEVRFERSDEGKVEHMACELVYAFKYMTAAGNPEATSH